MTSKPPIRTLHHFACTGGTLFSKLLSVMPDTVLLSEIDPLSRIGRKRQRGPFAPTDTLRAMAGTQHLSNDDDMIAVFNASMKELEKRVEAHSQKLLIRDHTHSHYCFGEVMPRKTLRRILMEIFDVQSILTVRHPLYSYMSLSANDWIHFAPKSIEEYSKRYLLFLNDYADAPIVKYEALINSTEKTLLQVCEKLSLPYRGGAESRIGEVKISGDSGRSGAHIAERPPRSPPTGLIEQLPLSPNYRVLCDRLEYDSNPLLG